MFCTNCGTRRTGRFCAGCGKPFENADEAAIEFPAADWRNEVRYAVLLYFPEVRARLADVPKCAKRMSGEQWLDICDKAFKPLGGVSLSTVAAIAAPLNEWLGIKTGKTRSETIAAPTGQVIVDVLCAFARHGLSLEQVHQADAGCVLEAKIPSDLWSFEGRLVVTIERAGAATKIEAATNIPGQKYDWGKSNRCLDQLFGDLHAEAAA